MSRLGYGYIDTQLAESSANITIPEGTILLVLGCTGYSLNGAEVWTSGSFTIDSDAMTLACAYDPDRYSLMSGVYYRVNPSTGTVALRSITL